MAKRPKNPTSSKPPAEKSIEEKIKEEFEFARIFPPIRSFEPGEKVEFGNHEETTVIGRHQNGEIYEIEFLRESRQGKSLSRTLTIWSSLYKKGTKEAQLTRTQFVEPERLRFTSHNTGLSGLLLRAIQFGVDFNPEYQRELVWDLQQKEALIETIFDRGSIGTFAFNRRPYGKEGPLYEIVDGKQRLTTLLEFTQDQFRYRGLLYSELHPEDRYQIKNTQVLIYDLEEAAEEDILLLFLRLNRAGTPVDEAHIQKVRARYNEIVQSRTLPIS